MIWSFQWCYDCGWSNPFPSGKIISKPCVSCMWPCIPPTCVPVVFPICSRCSLKPTHVLMIFPIMFHMYVPMYVSQMVFILYIDNMSIYMSYKSYMWYVSHLFPISFAQPAAVDQSHHEGTKGRAVGRAARLLCWAGAAEFEEVSYTCGHGY
jgi:hypothetical protein